MSSSPETRTARAPQRAWPLPRRELEPGPVGQVDEREREQDQPQRPPDPAEEALHPGGERTPGVGLHADAGAVEVAVGEWPLGAVDPGQPVTGDLADVTVGDAEHGGRGRAVDTVHTQLDGLHGANLPDS